MVLSRSTEAKNDMCAKILPSQVWLFHLTLALGPLLLVRSIFLPYTAIKSICCKLSSFYLVIHGDRSDPSALEKLGDQHINIFHSVHDYSLFEHYRDIAFIIDLDRLFPSVSVRNCPLYKTAF